MSCKEDTWNGYSRDRVNETLCLSQSSYLKKLVKNLRMTDANISQTPIGGHFKLSSIKDDEGSIDTDETPYASAVGSIMYAMGGYRPNLDYEIGLVSCFMSKPGEIHWEAVKWLLRYIKELLELQLVYTKKKDFQVQGFCDSDFAADLDKRRSISGYMFIVGENIVS